MKELFHSIKSYKGIRNASLFFANFDGQIKDLKQAVNKRNSHIAILPQTAAERDGQIVNLKQAIA